MASGEKISSSKHSHSISTSYKITPKGSRTKSAEDINCTCPNCGSNKTNKVSWSNNYCQDCCIEFNFKTNKMYTIMFDGELVDYHVNEVENCG